MFFQNPPDRASRQLVIPRIAAVGTSFSPLPCQAWHGYVGTSAHRVEVEVCADGSASAPLSGAAAAAPPAGAGGGQMGSSARARRSLAVACHAGAFLESPLGARPDATKDGGGSQPEERHGVAAAVLRITRRRKKPGTGGFWKIPVPIIF
jgi:hypothetical protein